MSKQTSQSISEVAQATYYKSHSTIQSIIQRKQDRYYPKSTSCAAEETIQFDIIHDELVDLSTACLCFNLGLYLTDGSTAADASDTIANAADVIQDITVSYRGVQVENFNNANTWTNVFLAQSANRSFCETEASAMLGMTNQVVNSEQGARTGTNSYLVALPLVSGFFRIHQYLPLVGNALRITIKTAPANSVVSKKHVTTDTYKLSNISLLMDTIIAAPVFRDMLITAMGSSEGIRLGYSTYSTESLDLTASTVNNFRIENDCQNAVSLHMVRDCPSKKVVTADNHTLMCQSYPLSTFYSLVVRCGTREFTPFGGILTYQELYRAAELCHNMLSDITGSGYIDQKIQTDGYTQNEDPTADEAAYGLCVMSTSLELAVESDDAVINDGISQENGFRTFHVRLQTTEALNDDDKILSNIVHKRFLWLHDGMAEVER